MDSPILLRSGTEHVYNLELINKPALEKLRSLKIPNIVHVVFCEKKFKFKHYVSLFSVWKVLRPFRIIMHIQGSMISDRHGYSIWFKRANDLIPNIEPICHNDTGPEETSCIRLGTGSLFLYGGILATLETVFLVPILEHSYEENINVGYTDSAPSKVSFIAAPSGSNILKKLQQPNFQTKKLDLSNLYQCDTIDKNFSVKTLTPVCLHLSFELSPKDIFNLDNEFGSIIRNLVYGTKELLRPKKLKNNLIPKIVHYVWLGGNEITFPMYLSFLSTVKIIMPHRIYIHCDIQPRGIFWDKIMSVNGVVFVEYGPIHFVFGKRITSIQDEINVVRTDILYRYGGIYINWNAYWLKPIDNLLTSGYEFIVAFYHLDRDPFPDSINLGIILATPGASFLKHLEQTYRYYRGVGVYKLYEEVPELVQIEPRLQVCNLITIECLPYEIRSQTTCPVLNNEIWCKLIFN
ncbi:hypothetical protein ACJMK2_035203 [Sinanodonta woodiana]|uniref:Uncharacterized protein n=1 Tax=Sinanodonta woodiana TaxID=1069815 RepID=A0ABD3WU66_SINWO